jgi:uncharacterized tellurite resistance protein B-like protein
MLTDLSPDDRLRLMKFVCSFAWADLEVRDSERTFVANLVERLDLGEEERQLVQGWLTSPPTPEEVDPFDVPTEHRKLFLDVMLQMIAADGELDPAETETYNLFSQLLA